MSLANVTITGIVERNPEKRFSSDNKAITSFYLQMAEDIKIRVLSFGKMAEAIADTAKANDTITVTGKLQTNKVEENTTLEIVCSQYELATQTTDVVAPDNEIGSEEIPFD